MYDSRGLLDILKRKETSTVFDSPAGCLRGYTPIQLHGGFGMKYVNRLLSALRVRDTVKEILPRGKTPIATVLGGVDTCVCLYFHSNDG